MVRATVGLLLCSQALGDSALMQTQTQSDHILDALHTGSGRVKKMQENTQAMEDQYKALLQNIVTSGSLQDPKTGTPFLPAQNFFDVVDKQFGQLLDELESEKNDNNQLLVAAHNAVKKCNSDMEDKIGVLVNTELATVRSNRATHSTCRNTEDNNIGDMEGKCKTFDDYATKCSDHQDWYAAYSVSGVNGGEDNTLANVIDSAELCKNAVATVDSQAAECDTAQSTFKSSYCTYETRLTTAICGTHSTCYTDQTGYLQTSNTSVAELEKEQKTIFRMVKKVQCYIEKLKGASVDSMPVQADIVECSGLVPDDASLDITYDPVEAKSNCQTNSQLGTDTRDLANAGYKPGEGAWYNDEMSGLTEHNKLNTNCKCGHSCPSA